MNRNNVERKDEEWMALYLQGEYTAFEALYRNYSPKVRRFLLSKGLSLADAEDVGQAIFLKFHRVRGSYRPNSPVAPWIFTIARSQWIDFLRKKKQEPHAMLELEEETLITHRVDENPTLAGAGLEALSVADQTLLRLKYMEGKTFAEVSRAVGVTEISLRKKFSRLIQKLKKGVIK